MINVKSVFISKEVKKLKERKKKVQMFCWLGGDHNKEKINSTRIVEGTQGPNPRFQENIFIAIRRGISRITISKEINGRKYI